MQQFRVQFLKGFAIPTICLHQFMDTKDCPIKNSGTPHTNCEKLPTSTNNLNNCEYCSYKTLGCVYLNNYFISNTMPPNEDNSRIYKVLWCRRRPLGPSCLHHTNTTFNQSVNTPSLRVQIFSCYTGTHIANLGRMTG